MKTKNTFQTVARTLLMLLCFGSFGLQFAQAVDITNCNTDNFYNNVFSGIQTNLGVFSQGSEDPGEPGRIFGYDSGTATPYNLTGNDVDIVGSTLSNILHDYIVYDEPGATADTLATAPDQYNWFGFTINLDVEAEFYDETQVYFNLNSINIDASVPVVLTVMDDVMNFDSGVEYSVTEYSPLAGGSGDITGTHGSVGSPLPMGTVLSGVDYEKLENIVIAIHPYDPTNSGISTFTLNSISVDIDVYDESGGSPQLVHPCTGLEIESVPEPSMALLGFAGAGVMLLKRRRKI